LPGGAYITNGTAVFRISYAGGDGNDVVLYRVNPPPQITSITRLTNNWIQFQAAGVSNLTYTIQASTNLLTWTNLATVPANTSGIFSYTDTNTALFPRRFYRALSP
jgi:hypothetical protein